MCSNQEVLYNGPSSVTTTSAL